MADCSVTVTSAIAVESDIRSGRNVSAALTRIQWRIGALACPFSLGSDGQARAPILHWITRLATRCHPERSEGSGCADGIFRRPTRPDPSLPLGVTSCL